jgi:hypothetical protein
MQQAPAHLPVPQRFQLQALASPSATPVVGTPTVTWNLLVAGDIAQCGATAAAQTAAERTAQLVSRQIAAAGTVTQILTLGDNV